MTEEAPETLSREVPTNEGFAVPEAFAEKPWSANIKSEEDLYNQFDNLQGLIGKKSIPNADSSDDDWNSFYDQLRPESSDKYELNLPEGVEAEVDADLQGKYKDLFHQIGLTPKQAQQLFEGDLALKAAMQGTEPTPEELDADFNDKMVGKFGEDASKVLGSTMKALSGIDKETIESFSNDQLVALSEVFHNNFKRVEGQSPQRGDQVPSRNESELRSEIVKVRSEIRNTDQFSPNRKALVEKLETLQKQHSMIAN